MGRLTPEDLSFLFRVRNAISYLGMRVLTMLFVSSKLFLVARTAHTYAGKSLISCPPCCKFLASYHRF
jgi:hypothetical protein